MKINWKKWLLVILGTISWSLTMVKSGWIYSYGMGFWGPNGHDGIWHIALAESLSRGSRGMPVFSGEYLQNYHVGFDLLVAALHRLTTIPVVNLYFQIIPPLLALFVGVLTYKFVLLWRDSKKEAFWATFFVYFGGNFGWIITVLKDRSLGGESMFWSQQAISTLVNPPFALSLILILAGLIFLIKLKKSPNLLYMIYCTLLFGVLIQIKAYAGILTLGALFVGSVFEYWKERKLTIFKVFIGTFILSAVLFLPFNKSAGNLLIFQPFWFLETMMGYPDRLGWLKFYSAMTNYRLGGNWIKGIPAYLIAFIIFWVGNMGTRLMKELLVIRWIKKYKEIGWLEGFIVIVVLAGVIIPMFFLQKGTPWNTIQFFYYSLFFSGILAGVALGEFVGNSRLNTTLLYSIEVGIILLTIPTTAGTLWYNYIPSRPPAKIGDEELQALKFLSQQPEGIVLTYLFDREAAKKAENNPPRPLYLYESTAYVSAFAKKPVYLEDEVNLDITGYDWRERRKAALNFLVSKDKKEVRSFFTTNNIKYIYWLKGQRAYFGESQLGISRIFENGVVDIYKVD